MCGFIPLEVKEDVINVWLGVVGFEDCLELFDWCEDEDRELKSKDERESFCFASEAGGVRSKKKPRALPPGSITRGGVLTRRIDWRGLTTRLGSSVSVSPCLSLSGCLQTLRWQRQERAPSRANVLGPKVFQLPTPYKAASRQQAQG